MKYRLDLTATARTDIREAARYLSEKASPAAAEKWLAGLYKAMSTLQTRPARCPVAAASHKFSVEIRESIYGR